MKIPSAAKDRDEFVLDVLAVCLRNIRERRARYQRRRRWFLFGNDTDIPCRYNRLYSHLDLVASFLFSPDSLRMSLREADRNNLPSDSELLLAFSDVLPEILVESGISDSFEHALLWSLCYDTMFLKIGWHGDEGRLSGHIIDPLSMAVFDERESSLGEQDAFAHLFTLPFYDAAERLKRAGKAGQIKQLQEASIREEQPSAIERSVLISSTGGANLGGPLIGQVNTEYQFGTDYRADVPPGEAVFRELWIWDSGLSDYRSFLIAGDGNGAVVVQDSKDVIEGRKAKAESKSGRVLKYSSECNSYLPGEHPFVSITPYRMYNYFWGECPAETRMRSLQEWTNKRLQQIEDILELHTDPPIGLAGFIGLAQEKAEAFGGPGTRVWSDLGNAEAKPIPPNLPPDLFAEFNEIGGLFLEASGLTSTIAGHGSEGVRSREHARQLMGTGAGRIKKTAVALEPALSKIGEISAKLLVENYTSEIKTKRGLVFVPANIEFDFSVHVDGHSHSPLYTESTHELAEKLFRFSAIDKESLLRMTNPPGQHDLIENVRKIEEREREMAQASGGGVAPVTKGEDEAKRSHHGRSAR